MTYRRAGAPVEDRVADLLGRMTLAEKVGQVNQKMFGWHAYDGTGVTGRFRELVARFGGMGALYGLFRADAWYVRRTTYRRQLSAPCTSRALNWPTVVPSCRVTVGFAVTLPYQVGCSGAPPLLATIA